jgi:hypothetical protein
LLKIYQHVEVEERQRRRRVYIGGWWNGGRASASGMERRSSNVRGFVHLCEGASASGMQWRISPVRGNSSCFRTKISCECRDYESSSQGARDNGNRRAEDGWSTSNMKLLANNFYSQSYLVNVSCNVLMFTLCIL